MTGLAWLYWWLACITLAAVVATLTHWSNRT